MIVIMGEGFLNQTKLKSMIVQCPTILLVDMHFRNFVNKKQKVEFAGDASTCLMSNLVTRTGESKMRVTEMKRR